jgi:hypothetical protein
VANVDILPTPVQCSYSSHDALCVRDVKSYHLNIWGQRHKRAREFIDGNIFIKLNVTFLPTVFSINMIICLETVYSLM